jgi:hypothetical protein
VLFLLPPLPPLTERANEEAEDGEALNGRGGIAGDNKEGGDCLPG